MKTRWLAIWYLSPSWGPARTSRLIFMRKRGLCTARTISFAPQAAQSRFVPYSPRVYRRRTPNATFSEPHEGLAGNPLLKALFPPFANSSVRGQPPENGLQHTENGQAARRAQDVRLPVRD